MKGRGFAAGYVKRLCKKVLKIDAPYGHKGSEV